MTQSLADAVARLVARQAVAAAPAPAPAPAAPRALDHLPAGAAAPRVRDRKSGRILGLHVPPLDSATHLGVLFGARTGRGQPARALAFARVARDRAEIVAPGDAASKKGGTR